MILHRIRLRDFRGTRDREIRIGPGVTIVEGPNEIGKSSIAEALNLLLEEKATSRKAQVRAIQPVDREAGPEVEAEIETGPYRLVCRKRFLKSPETVLRLERPRPESLTGDAAHQRLHEILAETLDLDLWKALQIQQGTGIVQARLAESRSLASALDAAAGGAGGLDQDGGLFERVRREYERHFQPRQGGERLTPGVEAALRQSLEEAEELAQALARLDEDVRLSERLAREAQRLDRERPALERELQERERRWAEVSRVQGELERLDERRRSAGLEVEAAERRLEDRRRMTAELQEARARLELCLTLRDDLQSRWESAVDALEQASAAETAARRAQQQAEQAAALAEADCAHLHRVRDRARLGERLERIEQLMSAARAARDVLARGTLDEEAVEALREAEFTLRRSEERLAEGSPRLALLALADVDLEADGGRLTLRSGEERNLPVSDALTLTLPDLLSIRVEPGSSLDELQASRETARQGFEALLALHGLASLDDALARAEVLRQARTDLEIAEGRVAAEQSGESMEALRDRLARLEGDNARHLAARGAEPPLPGSEAEADRRLGNAEEARAGARDTLEAATAARGAAERERDLLDAGLRRALEDVREAETRSGALAERLDAHRRDAADEALTRALESARLAQAAVAAEHRRLHERLAGLNPERAEALRQAARAALADNERGGRDNETRRVAVRARLEQQQEAGLYERLEQARARAEHHREELDRLRRQAAAVRLLFETLKAQRDAARSAYVRPLTERIESLGRILFDTSFQVGLDEGLGILSRTLDGHTIPFDGLSKGTQEQLGILARLAVAMTVAGEEGVPLILDDALGYSDPERLRGMGPALARAGQAAQLVILTCTPERFRYIPGATVLRLGESAE
ncbi:MAG: AAA family ATPase [Chromatiales bacterium]|jgi:DNA repair exonuclease SbcCD ATPase subunit